MIGGELAQRLSAPPSIAFAAALVTVLAATPVVRRLAVRWGFVDRPARHKAHQSPTPMLGGVALVLAVIVGVLVAARADANLPSWARVLTAGLVLAVLGAWDDRRPLPVAPRLVIQLIVVGALTGSGVRWTPLLGAGPEWASMLVTIAWLLLMTNAVNLLDNMDGVAPSMAAVAAAAFLLLGAGAPAAALAGACLGFLWFNRPVARVFLGDAGSLPLGLWLGVLGAEVAASRGGLGVVLPALVLAVPLFDTALVSWSRVRRGHNPLTTPGLDHVAHRLRRLGLGPWTVMLVLVAIGALNSGVALVLDRSDVWPPLAWALALVAGGVVVWAAVQLERPRPLGASHRAPDTTSR